MAQVLTGAVLEAIEVRRIGLGLLSVSTAMVALAGCGASVSVSGNGPASHGATRPTAPAVSASTVVGSPGPTSGAGPTASGSATPTTPTLSTPTPPAATASPSVTVKAYIAAINAHDYREAWNLGGKNVGESYKNFVAGYADTESDTLTIESVSGDTVNVVLVSRQRDGSQQTYKGSYTVSGVIITGFHITKAG